MKNDNTKKVRYTYKTLLNDFYGLNMKYGISIPPKELKKIQAMLKWCHVVGGEKTCKTFLQNYEKELKKRKELTNNVQ